MLIQENLYLCPHQFKCPGGGIGRRAGFKIQCLRTCGFDSRPGYQKYRVSDQSESEDIHPYFFPQDSPFILTLLKYRVSVKCESDGHSLILMLRIGFSRLTLYPHTFEKQGEWPERERGYSPILMLRIGFSRLTLYPHTFEIQGESGRVRAMDIQALSSHWTLTLFENKKM